MKQKKQKFKTWKLNAKNLNLILKSPKLTRIYYLFFDSKFVSRFKQWEFFNGLILNFLNASVSYVDFNSI
ncbi:hypothetical protein DRF60_03470 [Chryseobacterium elymi]|uniref:Uncharacterized protein n=1 Tax=Chryseobacterium elymi TaxID=395936 RepID=A0A3D9DPY4_9FLAO|nr:hypothetical protein DRF60_03470 [Chryseobacterium elymi]